MDDLFLVVTLRDVVRIVSRVGLDALCRLSGATVRGLRMERSIRFFEFGEVIAHFTQRKLERLAGAECRLEL